MFAFAYTLLVILHFYQIFLFPFIFKIVIINLGNNKQDDSCFKEVFEFP